MLVLRISLAITLLSLLGIGPVNDLSAQEKRRLVVCSTTQVADFARQVVGDRWEVKSILAEGEDPHLYETKPGDATLVAQADLCLENGWHLEGKDWMRRLATGAGKPLVTCVEGLKPLALEDEQVHDPHAWFSPENAGQYVRNITAAVAKVDPAHQREYEARAALYLAELRVLQTWIQKQLSEIPANQRVLVTSHDAFNYFCHAFKFEAKTPVGWSTGDEIGGGGTEARRQQTIASIKATKVKAIFVETSVNDRLIRTIAEEAGVKIGGKLYSDSMGKPGSAGETYLGMMRENVLTIVEALR
jgi:manganese/iron transport system substrate-binding protein